MNLKAPILGVGAFFGLKFWIYSQKKSIIRPGSIKKRFSYDIFVTLFRMLT